MQNNEEFILDLIDIECSTTYLKTDFYNMDGTVVSNQCLENNIDSIRLFNSNTIIEDNRLLNIAIERYPSFLTKLENYNDNMGLKILEKNIDLVMFFPNHFKTEKICKYVISKKYFYLPTFSLETISNIDNILKLMIISSPGTSIESMKEFYD